VTLVVLSSVAANGVIGRDGDLAWRNSEDLLRVKAMTMGHVLLMGRRNFESIGRPLPGRRTVVLTRQPDWTADGVTVAHDLESALDAARAQAGDGIVFVFGGGELYEQLLDRADVLELTEIDAEIDGDVYFPRIEPDRWTEVSREPRDGFSWVRYERADRVRAGG
jgi:dihydrofolate reductase